MNRPERGAARRAEPLEPAAGACADALGRAGKRLLEPGRRVVVRAGFARRAARPGRLRAGDATITAAHVLDARSPAVYGTPALARPGAVGRRARQRDACRGRRPAGPTQKRSRARTIGDAEAATGPTWRNDRPVVEVDGTRRDERRRDDRREQ